MLVITKSNGEESVSATFREAVVSMQAWSHPQRSCYCDSKSGCTSSEPARRGQVFDFLAAKFGPLMGSAGVAPVMGRMVLAKPEDGCLREGGGGLENARALSGNIVVVRRGRCMFPEKVCTATSVPPATTPPFNSAHWLLH
jgi:hypothetical protein